MNATRVSIRAGRKPGMILMFALLLLTGCQSETPETGELVVTVTGTVGGGWDEYGIFFKGKEAINMDGQPFTLVFIFDGSKGEVQGDTDSSDLSGVGPQAPGKAVLTIGGGSYTFGGEKFSRWNIYRSRAFVVISVSEKDINRFFDSSPAVDVRMGGRSLSESPDWRASLPRTDVEGDVINSFVISHSCCAKVTRGYLNVRTLEIRGPKSWWQW